MDYKYIIINVTFDREEDANIIGNTLLKEKLVCCVQMSRIDSKYFWEGDIKRHQEILLVLKTRKELYKLVEKTILKLHNYKTPQIIAYPIVEGYNEYLSWIDLETNIKGENRYDN